MTAADKFPFRLLLVEDNENDAVLCQRLLKKFYPETRCDLVETAQEFSGRLRSTYYDVILADYALGPWSGLDAFHLMREAGRDVPFILVTGALGDAQAVECVKTGITDYILKDNPERLPFAIARALKEKELLEEHKRADHALKESEAKFRALAEEISSASFIDEGSSCYANHAAEQITGYSREELTKMNFAGMIGAESRKFLADRTARELDSAFRCELPIMTKQRDQRWLDVTVGRFQMVGGLGTLITAFDITERKDQQKAILNLDATRFSHVELPVLRS